jgi:hypothetical protein
MYSKKYAIEYTQKIYNIDISQYEDCFDAVCWDYPTINIYDIYENEYQTKIPEDKSRSWFNKYGRDRYIRFI